MPELNKKVRLWRGDITRLQVDAITNAANWKLQGGRGICGAIFQKAGWHQLQAECNMLAPCPEGQTKVRSKRSLLLLSGLAAAFARYGCA